MAALFALLAVAMTWPLAANLSLATAHPGDPFINAWILDWVAHAATTDAPLFHGNIFHPARYTLAFSENLFGIALVMAPFLATSLSRLTIVNMAMLIGFATAGYAMARLGRRITGSWLAGIAAGIFFAFVPWRFTHLTHLQHEWTLWMPLALLALVRLRSEPSTRHTALLAGALVMNGLTNLHWFAFGSVAIACAALVLGSSARFWTRAAVAMVVSAAAMLPVLLPYREAQKLYAMRGDPAETLSYSARPSDWLLPSLHNRLYGPLNDATVDPERWLFPGALSMVLAVAACFVARRERRFVILAIVLIAIGFIGSLGLHAWPGRFLFEHIPLFRGIRVPARWSMIAYLGLALSTSIAVAHLPRRWMRLGVAALLLIELNAAPIRWYLTPGDVPPVYRWLAARPHDGPVVEVPFEQEATYEYLLHATTHHRPLVNGVSGFRPPLHESLLEQWQSNPIPPSFLTALEQHGATTLIMHADALREREPVVREWLRRETAAGRIRLVQRFDRGPAGDLAYAVRNARIAPAPHEPAITGALAHPLHWERIEGPLAIEGFVRGPHPIARVELFFDNRQERVRATLEGTRFFADFARRPDAIRADTDLQVEITDVRGNVHRLPQVWLRWSRPGERLRESPLPQTADLGAYAIHPHHTRQP